MTDATATNGPTFQTITIQGLQFQAPSPYREGHVVNAAEASTLNQTLGENLRNNFAGKVRAALDVAEKAAQAAGATAPIQLSEEVKAKLASDFAAYAESYTFQGKRPGRAPADPVEKEAWKMGKELVLSHLRKHNFDIKTLADGQLDSLVTQALEKRQDIWEEARRRVDAVQALANQALDMPPPAPAAA